MAGRDLGPNRTSSDRTIGESSGPPCIDVIEAIRSARSTLGASPRASIALLKTAQVVAASQARGFVTPDDVKPMAGAVLRHRLMLHPDAQLQGVSADDRIADIVSRVAVPRLTQ